MNLYQIVISSSLCDVILNYNISAHLHNICTIQSDKWGIYEERYYEKNNYSKCFPQLHVPYTLGPTGCNSYFEIINLNRSNS